MHLIDVIQPMEGTGTCVKHKKVIVLFAVRAQNMIPEMFCTDLVANLPILGTETSVSRQAKLLGCWRGTKVTKG